MLWKVFKELANEMSWVSHQENISMRIFLAVKRLDNVFNLWKLHYEEQLIFISTYSL